MEPDSDDYMHPHSSPDRIDDTDHRAVSSYDQAAASGRQPHEADASDSEDGSEGHAALLSQNDETWDTSDVISDVFDQRVRVLAATLESVESKCILLSSKLIASEEQAVTHMNRWVQIASLKLCLSRHAPPHQCTTINLIWVWYNKCDVEDHQLSLPC